MSTSVEQQILAYFKANPEPVNVKTLNRALGRRKNEINDLRKALDRLKKKGKVGFFQGQGYGAPNPQKSRHLAARVAASKAANQNQASGRDRRPFAKTFNLVGIVIPGKDGGLALRPCNKEDRRTLPIAADGGAKPGDVVVAEPVAGQSELRPVTVAKILGRENDPGLFSLISLHEQGLCAEFSAAALAQAQDPALTAIPAPDATRIDMRHIPLVTIDGPDSRDFDDAVFAEATPNGFHLIVAIADVAHYVRPGDALDQEALMRGNSTYFPDRVLPMLPQELSNGVCSLKPGVDRACLAFDMSIDRDGKLTSFELKRGVMKSAARLTYEQVQAARDGQPDAAIAPLMANVITPLYDAYAALAKARAARGTLDLDLPERKVIMAAGAIQSVKPYVRLDSNKLIEEFMILANVAAATALENKKEPCVYRVHAAPPSADKLEGLRNYAEAFGIAANGDLAVLENLHDLLAQAKQQPYGDLIANQILRTQAKAVYAPVNQGHFGLALDRYAHFTSPIRRYADLLVHRLLISAFNKGAGGINHEQRDQLTQMAEQISETERSSDLAERSAKDRYATAYLAQQVGQTLRGRISSISQVGLFVQLKDTGVTGLLPLRLLPDDHYQYDASQHALIGAKTGRLYRAGATMDVELKEAEALSGRVIFKAANDNGADIPGTAFKSRPKGPQPG